MRAVVISLVLCLSGCGTPGPEFRGVPATRMEVGGSTFDIRVKGRRAEAIRQNPEWAMRLSSVAPRAFYAIEAVSGCRVRRLTGDQAQMVAYLDCGQGAPRPPFRLPELECEIDEVEDRQGVAHCAPGRPPIWPRPPPES